MFVKRWGLLLSLLAAFLAYSNIFGNDFVVDDNLFIVNWPLIQDPGNFFRFFGPHNQPAGEEGVYSPLKVVIHFFNYQLWQDNVFGYHFYALIVQLLATFFVYKIAERILRVPILVFLAALFFAVHPVHTEAITSMTGSVDTTGVLFLFISFYYYLCVPPDFYSQAGEAPPVRSIWRDRNYIFALLSAFFAIYTHELCVSLPFLFFYYDFCFRKPAERAWSLLWKRQWPFLAILAGYVFLKFTVLGNIARGGYLADSFYLTMLVVIKAVAKYIWVLLFPFSLACKQVITRGIFAVDMQEFDQDIVLNQSFFDSQTFISALVIMALLGLAVWSYPRNRLVTFCIGWFFLSLLPVLNIIPTGCYYAERYLYLGSLGYCMLLAFLLGFPFVNVAEETLLIVQKQKGNHPVLWQRLSLVLILGITFFYLGRTMIRNQDFRNSVSIYQAEGRANPDSIALKSGLGLSYIEAGAADQAIAVFHEAIAKQPNNPELFFQLAQAHIQLRQAFEAKTALKRAVILNPQFAEAYYNLAVMERVFR